MRIKKTSQTTPIQANVVNTNSNSTTDSYSCNYINNELEEIINLIYPVGSIYMSVNSANPSTLFGGIWEAWGSGRVPVGIDANDTDFNEVEETGGEKTHTLTIQEMPSHRHEYTYSSSVSDWTSRIPLGSGVGNGTSRNGINATGGGQAHNNLQPYIVCYIWKRTA